MSLSPMSHVKFKKRPCRPVGFRGQGPFIYKLWRPYCGSVHNINRVAKFYLKGGRQRTPKLKVWLSSSYFGPPHFATLLYVCENSSLTAVIIGKRKIT